MNSSIPDISVVIPVYNLEEYIGGCIQSVLTQTHSASEIIVIDDGSTDNSTTVVESFGDQVKLMKQPNQGVSSARNAGIEAATGAWIVFLDADDELLPDYLSKMGAAIDNSDCSFGYCDARKEVAAGKFVDSSNVGRDDQVEIRNLNSIYLDPHLPMTGCIARKDLLLEVSCFDISLRTAEDTDLLLKIATISDILHFNEMLVLVRRLRVDSLSRGLDTYSDELAVYQNFITNHEGFRRKNSSLIRQVQSSIYLKWGDSLLYAGNRRQAMQKLLASLRISFRLKTMFLLIKCFIPEGLKAFMKRKNVTTET